MHFRDAQGQGATAWFSAHPSPASPHTHRFPDGQMLCRKSAQVHGSMGQKQTVTACAGSAQAPRQARGAFVAETVPVPHRAVGIHPQHLKKLPLPMKCCRLLTARVSSIWVMSGGVTHC